MGALCICLQDKTIVKEVPIDNMSGYLTDKLLHNVKLVASLIRAQAKVRGLICRKKVKCMNIRAKRIMPYLDGKCSYTIGENSGISIEELEDLFQKMPPLEANAKIVLKKPIIYSNKIIYYGEWNEETNMKHGRGIQLWGDGSKYKGYWKQNKANGKGCIIHADREMYDGDWVDDSAEGYGVYTHSDGATYEGTWKEDKQEGQGKELWPEGACYQGAFKAGKKTGKGVFKWADGSEYKGDFYDNMLHGKGTFVWSDKREYTGEWKFNKMEGDGTFTWPDRRKYIGHYKEDKKDGYGIFTWADGKSYRGYWKNGKQHGDGEYYQPNEKIWKKGYWCEGKRVKWNESSTAGDETLSKNI